MDITPKLFAKVGIVCFSVIFLASLGGLATTWGVSTNWARMSSIASLVFNFVLVLFFGTMLKNAPPDNPEDVLDVKELDELTGSFENAA